MHAIPGMYFVPSHKRKNGGGKTSATPSTSLTSCATV
eukprot:CAMPEP_0175986306 /NCGR_PEP_ID=MMETSP0108-20121206/50073_1 /TAXON_ID=195067 ORGANISM="Goniomonas pacifica, Strain CCMP1869" /NCGR_SAMPLE_ID=MMETSP0108 /ASSEMBLY_ACC=CAM_ASM_000204 /LENGTH=36 /DNA_ID= /DNA_START= /DNA_END= /DNA_ORIENTATION=